MDQFFAFFSENGTGLFAFFLCLIGFLLCTQWILWLTKTGRYKNTNTENNQLLYLIADFFVKIINDFRHLLALIIVSIFAFVLIYAVYHALDSQQTDKLDNLQGALQTVVATLGGIVGSIIGYYFGESVGKTRSISGREHEMNPVKPDAEEIEPVELPKEQAERS